MSPIIDEVLARRRLPWSAGITDAAPTEGQRETAAQEPASTGDHPVNQQRRAARTEPLVLKRLRANLSVLAQAGGNIVVLDEPDGVLLADGGMVGSRVADTVATLTPVPIRYLINTHWHFDHTDANEWFGDHGVRIIAHENTRRHLSEPTRVEDFDFIFEPKRPAGLPQTFFSDEYTLDAGRAMLTLHHYPPAHTDSDISICFDHADVLQVGDTWWNGVYPFIDYSTGGSIDGLIAATEWNLVTAGRSTLIVPGHGPVGNRAQLAAYYDMLVETRDAVARLKAKGYTAAAAVDASPTAGFDRSLGGGLVDPAFFVRLVYKGV